MSSKSKKLKQCRWSIYAKMCGQNVVKSILKIGKHSKYKCYRDVDTGSTPVWSSHDK